jgi:hypothetical protein
MKKFLNELACAVFGHTGLWYAELPEGRATTNDEPHPKSRGITLGRFADVPGELRPWRCTRCHRTLDEISKTEYLIEPDWLKELGW